MVHSREEESFKMNRCDTDPLWFLFASCGRPFMFADPRSEHGVAVLRSERRRTVGCDLEQRHGNYAAATIDEMVRAWGGDAKMTVAQDGSFVHVEPHDVLEGLST